MSTRKATLEDLKQIEELAKGWGKIVVRQHWGDDGPGLDVDITQMENVAMAALHGLMAGTLESAMRQQADRLGEHQACPTCGKMCPLQQKERSLVGRIGSSLELREPTAHCPACRRDFFPSASHSEIERARLHSVGPGEDRPGVGTDEVV